MPVKRTGKKDKTRLRYWLPQKYLPIWSFPLQPNNNVNNSLFFSRINNVIIYIFGTYPVKPSAGKKRGMVYRVQVELECFDAQETNL